VLFIAALVAATALLPLFLGGRTWASENPVTMSFILGALVLLAFSAIAYWLQLTRIYVVGLIFSAAFTTTNLLDTPLPLLIGGSMVLLYGLGRLARFMKDNPMPSEGLPYDG